MGFDWEIFRSAILAFWAGTNPYLAGPLYFRFYNPIWTLIILTPFSWLPDTWAVSALMLSGYVVLILIARHFKLRTWRLFCFLSSPFLIASMAVGNIDWLPMLGLIIPWPPMAIGFLLIKPQEGMGAILVILWRELEPYIRQRQWDMAILRLIQIGMPSSLLLLAQVLAYGAVVPHPLQAASVNLFPYCIPLGLIVLGIGLHRKDVRLGAAASPFLAPYAAAGSLIVTALSFPGLTWVAGWAIIAVAVIQRLTH